MKKNIPRKPRATAKVKGLAPALQQELYDYMEGVGDEKGHSYAKCIAWLKAQGVAASKSQLSEWRQWYWIRVRLGWSQELTNMLVEDDKKAGQKYTDEDLQRKGNRLFSELALKTCDDKAWARTQSLVVRKQAIAAVEKRLEFEIKKYEDRCAQAKEVESEPQMTPEEKEARIAEIMGTD
jgi:hypothetical protein